MRNREPKEISELMRDQLAYVSNHIAYMAEMARFVAPSITFCATAAENAIMMEQVKTIQGWLDALAKHSDSVQVVDDDLPF